MLKEAQAEAGEEGHRGVMRETVEENVKLKDMLAKSQAMLVEALRENEELSAQLAAEEREELEAEANASHYEHMLGVALENLKEAGVAEPFRTTTAAPTVQVGGGHTIPEIEYEDSILGGALLAILACFMLPFLYPCRRYCETRLYRAFPFIALFNCLLLAFTLNSLDLINFNTVFFAGVKLFEVALNAVQQVCIIAAAVVGGFVVWKFKDRIFESMGIETGSMILGEPRDWLTCWSMKRFRPIELFIWKVEGLPAAKLTSNNNTFCEVKHGYNVKSRTRVHHGAGHSCVFKESVQLNFDPYDTGSRLTLVVKHQNSMGSDDIAQVQLGSTQVERLSEPHDRARVLGWLSTAAHAEGSSSLWAPSRFKQIDLVPAGRIFLRFAPVPLEEEDLAEGCCSSCCGWFGPGASESGRRHVRMSGLEEGDLSSSRTRPSAPYGDSRAVATR